MGIFDPIFKGIGTFLAWIDSWAGNYLVVLLIFTILIEVLFIPFGIKQQKNSIRQAKLRPKEMAIRKKYAGRNDKVTQQKMAAEIQELYKQENFSQFSGCLPMLIQLPVILIIYQVVIKPLEYVVQLGSATIAKLTEAGTAVGDHFLSIVGTNQSGSIKLVSEMQRLGVDANGNFNPEKCLDFFRQNNFDATAMADLEDHVNQLPDFNVLGLNLGDTPSITKLSWLIIIPILTFVVYFFSTKLTRKFSYQPSVADQQTGCSNKVMDIVMPLFSLFISFRVPAAVGVYWIFKSILGTVKQFILKKAMPLPVFTEEDYKNAEKELKGKATSNERDIVIEPKKSLNDDDDDEPYPTFVGQKSKYDDDDSSDSESNPAPDKKQAGMTAKLDAAPLKDDGDSRKETDSKAETEDSAEAPDESKAETEKTADKPDEDDSDKN